MTKKDFRKVTRKLGGEEDIAGVELLRDAFMECAFAIDKLLEIDAKLDNGVDVPEEELLSAHIELVKKIKFIIE